MKPLMLIALLVCAAGLAACAKDRPEKAPEPEAVSPAPDWRMGRPAMHPELDDQDKLTSCVSCHEDASPEVQEAWFASRHGIANVKCYQCHGTYENLKLTPAVESCAACHADRLDHCPGDRACWACHIPHGFKLVEKKEVKE